MVKESGKPGRNPVSAGTGPMESNRRNALRRACRVVTKVSNHSSAFIRNERIIVAVQSDNAAQTI